MPETGPHDDQARDLENEPTLRDLVTGEIVFERYQLKEIVGRGGMGVVWQALDRELGRDVALKFVPEALVYDPESIADLKRETNRCLDLTHPCIVRIYDFATDQRRVAISMEYVDGGSLSAQKIRQPQHSFEVEAIASLVKQFLEGLDYAHEQVRIVHRDLKPANLMVHKGGRLKIADFGIASTMSDSVSRVSLKPASGTLLFMSPEQARGGGASVTDDLYSFGATVYDLVTGKPPFYSGDLSRQIEMTVPPSMGERRAELGRKGAPIPPEWEEVMAACLEKEARHRPQSAAEISERLLLGHSARAPRSSRQTAVPFASEFPPVPPGPDLVATASARSVSAPRPPSPPPATSTGAGTGTGARRPLALVTVIVSGLAAVLLACVWFILHDSGRRPPELPAPTPVAVMIRTATPVPAVELPPPPKTIPGSLIVNSIPAGAKVSLEGKTLGLTPLYEREVAPGNYRLNIEIDGYETVQLIARVLSGQTFETGLVRMARNAAPLATPAPAPQAPVFIPPATPVPVVVVPPASRTAEAQVRAVVLECLRARAARDLNAELNCYTSPVDYYDEGRLATAALRKSIESFDHLWPVYSVTSPIEIKISETGNPATRLATVFFAFEARIPAKGKFSRGLAKGEWTIRLSGGHPLIERCRETVSNRQKNF